MLTSLIKTLYKMQLLSPRGIYHMLTYLHNQGVNLMLLLYLPSKLRGEKIALVDDSTEFSYKDLYERSLSFAYFLSEQVNLQEKQKVAFLCHNHASFICYLFAASRLGATIYLLNTSMSTLQFNRLHKIHKFDLLIYDLDYTYIIEDTFLKNKIISKQPIRPERKQPYLPKSSRSRIILLTSGTTGMSKEVTHQPSVTNFLQPFLAIINHLKLSTYQTAYVATPIFHGYGIAILLVMLSLGKKTVITEKFQPEKACQLIKSHQVEVISVVPLMVHRLLNTNEQALTSLRCIASGGARLSPSLVEKTRKTLGDVLYNLYGTSEAGLNLIAEPRDLALSPETIGRPIKGTKVKIVDGFDNELPIGNIGELCFQNKWSMRNKTNNLIRTGDLGYINEKGLFFLKGRQDEMIISAGQNIFPLEIEQAILSHPSVEDAAVIGREDEEYGQKLVAYITLGKDKSLTEKELTEWLKPKLAKYQIPKEILVVAKLPYSSVGKLQKRQLINQKGS